MRADVVEVRRELEAQYQRLEKRLDREQRSIGGLFRVQLRRNHKARQRALESITKDGRDFVVRLGGRVRGVTHRFPRRRDAEQAVNDHYNAAIYRWLRAKR